MHPSTPKKIECATVRTLQSHPQFHIIEQINISLTKGISKNLMRKVIISVICAYVPRGRIKQTADISDNIGLTYFLCKYYPENNDTRSSTNTYTLHKHSIASCNARAMSTFSHQCCSSPCSSRYELYSLGIFIILPYLQCNLSK